MKNIILFFHSSFLEVFIEIVFSEYTSKHYLSHIHSNLQIRYLHETVL